MIENIRKVSRNPKIIISKVLKLNLLKNMNDERYLKLVFKLRLNRKLDFENVKTFNEKLQWLKINDKNPLYSTLVDKYEVRKYISKVIGEKYLIPLIGVYNNFEEIDFENLPNKFVLKTTHDSGGVVVCKNKEFLKINKVKRKINKSLKNNYYYWGREWPYFNVKPRIVCEKFMTSGEDDLQDYKLFCFNGQVKLILVCSERFHNGGLKETFFNKAWEKQEIKRPHCSISEREIEKPKKLDEMIKLAEKLSENIKFLRVDFYEVDGEIYFGELTFFPASGFEGFVPEKYDEILGSWLEI